MGRIDGDVLACLKNMTNTKEHEELPVHVEAMYFRVKKHNDHIGGGPLSAGVLAVVAELAEIHKDELTVQANMPKTADLPALDAVMS